MGHKTLTIEVYSCDECGWIGTEPRQTKVSKAQPGAVTTVNLGTRGGRTWKRLDCPICRSPILPSAPVTITEDPEKKGSLQEAKELKLDEGSHPQDVDHSLDRASDEEGPS